MDSLIPIGHLSSITGVSVRTIRYYEEFGILEPTKILENNYRYYDDEPVERLKVIIFLRKLGFNLREIKAVLTENNKHAFRDMLEFHQKQLDIELKEILYKREIFTQILAGTKRIGSQGSPITTITEVSRVRGKEIDLYMQNQMPVKIIGIGAGIINIVNKLVDSSEKLVCIHFDYNQKSLLKSKANKKIRAVGIHEEEKTSNFGFHQVDFSMEEEIRTLIEPLKDSELLFLVSQIDEEFEGSTAVRIARETSRQEVLTVGVISYSSISNSTDSTIQELRDRVDILLEIPIETVDPKNVCSKIRKPNSVVEDYKQQAISCLSSTILSELRDIEQIKSLTEGQKIGHVGTGRASGDNRGVRAIDQALASAQLYNDVSRVTGSIMSIKGSSNLKFPEIENMFNHLISSLNQEMDGMFEVDVDEEMKDTVSVTIILTLRDI